MNVEDTITLPSAARTASGTGDMGAFPMMFEELIVYLDVTAVAGTTPSMTVTYQSSPDGVAYYDNTAAATPFTAAGRQMIKVPTCAGNFGRLSYAITGTAPSFTFSAIVEGKRL